MNKEYYTMQNEASVNRVVNYHDGIKLIKMEVNFLMLIFLVIKNI
jgi:hypothetical protein